MKILLLTPGRGNICNEQRTMMLRLALRLHARGDTLAVADETTSGMLAHSRNVLLGTLAKRQDVTWGLWIDTDCYWNPDAVLEMSLRPESMIVWNYPIRMPYDVNYPPERLVHNAHNERNQFRRWTGTALLSSSAARTWSPDRRLIEIDQSAFGGVLMRRDVAVDMGRHLPPSLPDWDGRTLIPAFDNLQNRVGEDYSFCRRFRRAGGRIWCDPQTYVTNGTTGGRFADEIARCDRYIEQIPTLFSVAA